MRREAPAPWISDDCILTQKIYYIDHSNMLTSNLITIRTLRRTRAHPPPWAWAVRARVGRGRVELSECGHTFLEEGSPRTRHGYAADALHATAACHTSFAHVRLCALRTGL
jgi:hypothetical protein